MELFKGKPHLEGLLKGRRWTRVKARIKKMNVKVNRNKKRSIDYVNIRE
jgi:hypothetical protein